MGSLTLPASGIVYADTVSVIYTVEKYSAYVAVLRSLWQAATANRVTIISSELALMETLVGPLKVGDANLVQTDENFFQHPNTLLMPITLDILREAARLRATVAGLKTPDAIHAATALLAGCALFVTNDVGFRRVPGLPVSILDDVLAAP